MALHFPGKRRNKNHCVISLLPSLILPEPGPYLKVPGEIHSSLETCSTSQDGMSKATLHLEGPLEGGWRLITPEAIHSNSDPHPEKC